jgi:hypothetical protein
MRIAGARVGATTTMTSVMDVARHAAAPTSAATMGRPIPITIATAADLPAAGMRTMTIDRAAAPPTAVDAEVNREAMAAPPTMGTIAEARESVEATAATTPGEEEVAHTVRRMIEGASAATTADAARRVVPTVVTIAEATAVPRMEEGSPISIADAVRGGSTASHHAAAPIATTTVAPAGVANGRRVRTADGARRGITAREDAETMEAVVRREAPTVAAMREVMEAARWDVTMVVETIAAVMARGAVEAPAAFREGGAIRRTGTAPSGVVATRDVMPTMSRRDAILATETVTMVATAAGADFPPLMNVMLSKREH